MTPNNILKENPQRLLLLPVQDDAAWAFYKEAVRNFWTAEEIDLSHDDYTIQENDRVALKQVLAFLRCRWYCG